MTNLEPTTTTLHDGWTLRLADPGSGHGAAVPEHVRAALPIPAQVPGTLHTDLLAAGLIPDPYLDRHELTLDWVGRADWVYERELDVPADWFDGDGDGGTDPGTARLLAGTRLDLEADGLDTVATVTVNDVEVARTQNMHRRHVLDIGGALRPGSNRLQIRLDSAWVYAEALIDELGPRPNAYPTPFTHIRKSACNFGWDWGPTLVTAGIWRDLRLRRTVTARLDRVRPVVDVVGSAGVVEMRVDLGRVGADDGPLTLVGTVGGVTTTVQVPPGATDAVVSVQVPRPRLWWPVGLGDQPLYPATLRLQRTDGRVLDAWSADLGFRTVRLVTEPDDDGTSFSLEVNGALVPVRGANWIPDDCFLPRVTPERLDRRLDQAVDANINLLRVWGGGVYESEELYRQCDARGLLVWQDFLFACAAYPEEEPIRSEVVAEARDNVARLMPHPSLVLWNGNNENIWGWFDWGWQDQLGDRSWGLGYYLQDLAQAVAETDPSRPYWAGSPYSGSMDIHPNDPDHGCTHVWDVWNGRDWRGYADHRPRFVSEFGWQGPPTWSTVTESIRDEPLTPVSSGMLHHQKASGGNDKLERGLEPHLPVPSHDPADMADWHLAMQVNQARAVAFGIEHFRSLRPRNTGAIVWQLNDCWPVTSWAAVDGYGRLKPLWYALRAAYEPRLLTIQPDGDGLAVVGVNDLPSTWREPVRVARFSFDGTELAGFDARVVADRFGAARVRIPDDVARPGEAAAEILVATTRGGARAIHLFGEDRDLALPPLDVETAVEWDDDAAEAVVTITARAFVRDLCLFPDRVDPDAEADSALLTMLPGESATVRVTGLTPGDESALLGPLVLRAVNQLVTPGTTSA